MPPLPVPFVTRRGRLLPWLAAAVPLAWFLYAGDRGIDFGRHWDEPLLLTDVRTSLATRLLLPTGTDNYGRPGLGGGNYEYPSVLYWVGLAMTAPQVWRDGLDPAVPMATAFVDRPLFTVRLRQACLALTSLAVVGTFALGWRADGRWPAGLVAASLLATSWEVNYHSRFVATDGLLMAAATGCLLLCAAALRRPRTIWWAAVAAGLATGVKYPGGLLVVPVLTAAVLARPAGDRWPRLLRRVPLLVLAQLGTFVLTTPGAVLQPWNFAAWVRFNRDHYGTVGHFGHTILNHVAHLWAMVEYLLLTLPSHWPPASVAVSALAAVGAVGLARRDWRLAVVVLPFPALYVGYFSQQIVMLVRNLLVLAPVGAVLAGVGTTVIADAVRRRGAPGVRPGLRWAVAVPLVAVVVGDAAWEFDAAGHMAERRTVAWQAAAARDYLARHPDLRVFPSDGAAAAVGLPTIPAAGTRDVVLSFAHEDGDMWRWPANVPGLTVTTFGAFACNFDCYPNWMDDRLVLMDVAAARRVPVGQVERAVRRHDVVAQPPVPGTLLAYLNCGGAAAVTGGGVTIRAVGGTAYPCAGDVAVPQPDVLTIQADDHQVPFEVTGLDPRAAYLVGWSWWDWNRGHRRDSVWAAWGAATVTDATPPDPRHTVQLLGPTTVPSWPLVTAPIPHPLGDAWPPRPIWRRGIPIAPPRWATLPPAAYRDGRCRVVFRREVGADVVVSGLWVWRETR